MGLVLALALPVLHSLADPSSQAVEQLLRAAFSGDSRVVDALLSANPSKAQDWVNSELPHLQGQTAVHATLRGWQSAFDSADEDRLKRGRWKKVLRSLISAGADLSRNCPIIDALHYHNIAAFLLLGSAMTEAAWRACLLERDIFGQHALHVAASSQASGFARLFKSLEPRSTMAKKVGSVLGLTSPTNHTYVGLTSVQGLLELQVLGEKGLPLGLGEAWLEARDRMGRTALHVACEHGRLEVAYHLMSIGANASALDGSGLGCASLAQERGFVGFDDSWGRVEAAPRPAAPNPSPAALQSRQGRADLENCLDMSLNSSGGWSGAEDQLLQAALDSQAEEPVRFLAADMSRGDFLRDFVAASKPAIVEGCQDPSSAAWWTKEAFLEKTVDVSVGKIPYASLYAGRTQTMKLGSFVREHMDRQRNSTEIPLLVFDAHALALREDDLSDRARFSIDMSRLLGLDLAANASSPEVALRQLALGGPGSGTPVHFHEHALNALVYGLKRWRLFPPGCTAAEAAFSTEPAADFFARGLDMKPGVFDFVQRAGECVYVPQHWAHATLNLADSVSYALELRSIPTQMVD